MNQSFEPSVTVALTVDGKTVLEGEAPYRSRHCPVLGDVDVGAGPHAVGARAVGEGPEEVQAVDVPSGGHLWVAAHFYGFEAPGPRFGWNVEDQEPGYWRP